MSAQSFQIPTPIPPQPVPTAVELQETPNGVALKLSTAQGVQVYFLDRDTARGLAEAMLQASSGIVIARPSLVDL